MNPKIQYQFSENMWKSSGNGGWSFVSLPQEISEEIRQNLGWQEEGWGRLKASAKIGETIWETAIWFDTKKQTYLLPIKSEVRKKEKIKEDLEINITLYL